MYSPCVFLNWNPYKPFVLQGVERLHLSPQADWCDHWWDVNKPVSRDGDRHRAVTTLRSPPCYRRCEEQAGEADSGTRSEQSWANSGASCGHIGFYWYNPEHNPSPGEAVLKSQWIQDSLQRWFFQPWGYLRALEVPVFLLLPCRTCCFYQHFFMFKNNAW